MGGDGGGGHALPDDVAGHVGRRCPGLGQRLVDDPLQRGRHAETARPLGEVDPGQAGVELRLEERLPVGVGRRVGRQQLVDPAQDVGGLGGGGY